MIDGNKLGDAGYKYLGVSYSTMDCQAFVEKCLADCGLKMDLAGSNAWFREVHKNGWTGSPEDCVKKYGRVPKGAFLFILLHDGKEPAKYEPDGLGNASHIGIVTMPRGQGAIHSSSSRGCVAESTFKGRTIPNGGWNMVGLWDRVQYDGTEEDPEPVDPDPDDPEDRPMIRRGSKGEWVTLAQDLLMEIGYSLAPYGADGDFGKKTEAAVRDFQIDYGLKVDGIIGPATWNMLISESEKQQQGTGMYTVHIEHLDKTQATAICNAYHPNATMEEEE